MRIDVRGRAPACARCRSPGRPAEDPRAQWRGVAVSAGQHSILAKYCCEAEHGRDDRPVHEPAAEATTVSIHREVTLLTQLPLTGCERRFGRVTFRRFRLLLACAIAAVTASSSGRLGEVAAQGLAQGAVSAISAEALAQIDALVREKDTRSAVERKIDSQLLYELRMERGERVAGGVSVIETDLPYAPDGHVIVDVKALSTVGLLSAVATLGAEVISSTPEGAMLRAHIDIDHVEALASLPESCPCSGRRHGHALGRTHDEGPASVAAPPEWRFRPAPSISRRHRTMVVPLPFTGQGSRSSEGDITHLAQPARVAFGGFGQGIKIGVLHRRGLA